MSGPITVIFICASLCAHARVYKVTADIPAFQLVLPPLTTKHVNTGSPDFERDTVVEIKEAHCPIGDRYWSLAPQVSDQCMAPFWVVFKDSFSYAQDRYTFVAGWYSCYIYIYI